MITIKLMERTNDIHACIEGRPGCWGCGKTEQEAIGSLVKYHQEMFNIEINYEDLMLCRGLQNKGIRK